MDKRFRLKVGGHQIHLEASSKYKQVHQVNSKSIIKVYAKDLVQHLLQTGCYAPFEGYLLWGVIRSCI